MSDPPLPPSPPIHLTHPPLPPKTPPLPPITTNDGISLPVALKFCSSWRELKIDSCLARKVYDICTEFLVGSPRLINEEQSLFVAALGKCEVTWNGEQQAIAFTRHLSTNTALARQLCLLACQYSPVHAAKALAYDTEFLRGFFKGRIDRQLAWFDNFYVEGSLYGARALERWVYRNRLEHWDVLVWKDDHAHPPFMVAQNRAKHWPKLNVAKSVMRLLEIDDFWKCDEWITELLNGAFIALDTTAFAERMCERLDQVVFDAITSYVSTEKFAILCPRLLFLLNPHQLLEFVNRVPLISNDAPSLSWLIEQEKWSDVKPLLVKSVMITRQMDVIRGLVEAEQKEKLCIGDFLEFRSGDVVVDCLLLEWMIRASIQLFDEDDGDYMDKLDLIVAALGLDDKKKKRKRGIVIDGVTCTTPHTVISMITSILFKRSIQ